MTFWQEILKPIIGLSPMDGVTDASFRFITAKHGRPDVILTEFVNVETAFHAPHTLVKDMSYDEIERPVIAQIYGHTPEKFYQVAHIVGELGFDGLDINMGCPAKKVAASGSGAGLILTPGLARAIIRAAVQGIRDWSEGQALTDLNLHPELLEQVRILNLQRIGLESPVERRLIPVSVKTRLGYDRVVIDDWIRNLLEERPAAISLHGRTLKQMYKGNADWEAIARAAEISRGSGTLVLGNGDLLSMEHVYRRLSETAVDGVLMGRAAQGNPWIFRAKDEVKEALRSERPLMVRDDAVGLDERFRVLLEHSRLFERRRENPTFVGMRKHLAWYCKGVRGAAELRSKMVRTNGAADVVKVLRQFALQPVETGLPPLELRVSSTEFQAGLNADVKTHDANSKYSQI